MPGAIHGKVDAVAARTAAGLTHSEDTMRKMIFMAIAGFVWKKFMAKRTYNGTVPGRF
jgi:hypothetical protein